MHAHISMGGAGVQGFRVLVCVADGISEIQEFKLSRKAYTVQGGLI